MPTSKELVSNRPLTGTELARIILADVADLLARDTMLASHVGYGRVGVTTRITLHLDNPSMPEYGVSTTLRPPSDNVLASHPELAAIEGAPPLSSPSPEAYVSSTERFRQIESPNLARIEHGLPVTITASTPDGGGIEKTVVYPAEVVEGVGIPPSDLDLSAQVKAEWDALSSKQERK